MISLVVFPAWA